MYFTRSARILIIAAMSITVVSCSKDVLPCSSVPRTHPASLLHKVEEDPFNYVLLQYT